MILYINSLIKKTKSELKKANKEYKTKKRIFKVFSVLN